MSKNEAVDKLNDLLASMLTELKQAQEIVRQFPGPVKDRAEAYWLPHIKDALKNPRAIGCCMTDTIRDLEESENAL